MSVFCVRSIAAAAAMTVLLAATAHAGGFSKSSGYGTFGAGTSQTSVAVKSNYIDYKSQTTASANVESLFNGKILEANGISGNVTHFKGKGKVKYDQWKAAKAKVYAKGGNVMAKARAENYVTIYVGGHAHVVSAEVARAMARFTPLGTTAAADTATHIAIHSNGYIGTTTGSTAKASVRVAN